MSRIMVCLAVLGLVFVLGTSAHAQGIVVGGGWGLGNTGFSSPAFGGYGFSPYGGYPPSGYYGGYSTYYGGYDPYGFFAPPPQTVNTMGPLMQTIKQTTGRRHGGWR